MCLHRRLRNTGCDRRRVLQTMGAMTVPLIAGCAGDDTSDEAPDGEVLLGLDFGGEHLTEAPTVDGFEFYPTSDVREDIDLEEANIPLSEEVHWWDETLNFEPDPVAYNSHPEEGPQSDSVPPLEEIDETDHDRLYQTAYWAEDEFNIEVSLENGTYEVVVHLAEIFFSEEGERVFDLVINDVTVAEDLDIYAAAGGATALTVETEVEVTDNVLTVHANASVDNPQISGIEIRGTDTEQTPITIEESVTDSEAQDPGIERIDENPDAGFHFPYLLYTPGTSELSDGAVSDPDDTRPLLVRCSPYRGESSDQEERLDSGRSDIEDGQGRVLADELGTPALVALLPSRPDDESFGNLDNNSLQVSDPPFERLDQQLLAMIEDARDRLADEPYEIADEIHMDGFSANGEFIEQFTMLHPDRVNAISTGGNGAITIPKTELADDFPTIDDPDTDSLPWPVGVADLDELVEDEFNEDEWMNVGQFRYIGAEDQWDPDEHDHPQEYQHSQRYSGLGEERQEILLDIFGWEQVDERFETSQAIYEAIGTPTEFNIYEGVGHETTEEILTDIVDFHRDKLDETDEF